MILRLFSWLIGFPLAVVAVLFAVSNKGTTVFALWPLPFTVEAPLYLATLIALAAGFTVGGFIAWAGQGGGRGRARRLSDRLFIAERELKEAQSRAAAAEKKLAEKARPVSGETGGVATQALAAKSAASLPAASAAVH